jgi:hypothetical protein
MKPQLKGVGTIGADMNLETESYEAQVARWPKEGRHILAQFSADWVVVYQAYRPETGKWAAEHGRFGQGFSLSRMSWIKPNFLWMMYRCGWASKEGQEVVLAVRLKRSAFDEVLRRGVPSSYESGAYSSEQAWKDAVAQSDVRLQWDPDHSPSGQRLTRRAIQLGLRGPTLARYAQEWIVDIQDISDFVREQRAHVQNGDTAKLVTPKESVYSVSDVILASRLGLSSPSGPPSSTD